ncbi:MAG: redox-regulated ATPase YchF [Deltaproteobacteria bacterium]|nr:redox-regulated ATPase YchF [Deltaproteobacteria bacterium]
MGLSCGIVGLPNVGKSTIFNALTQSTNAPMANYPFCTIDPNVGIVSIPDPRLQKIAAIFKPEKVTPNILEVVDIAGLIKGASSGEGLGNKFLSHIREVQAILHVIRCFEDPNVIHVSGSVDPLRDIEVINTELALADLETVSKRLQNVEKKAKSQDKKMIKELEAIKKIKEILEKGELVRKAHLSEDEKVIAQELCLLTSKPVLYVANVSEEFLNKDSEDFLILKEYAEKDQAEVLKISGKVEAELASLTPEEQNEFLKDLGIEEPGLHVLIRKAFKLLNLRTFFTAGPEEVRAWTVRGGFKAPQAAGVIHSDFERGFIRAEVYHYNDLLAQGSEAQVKNKGLLRLEGKEYEVQDGDMMYFRFAT